MTFCTLIYIYIYIYIYITFTLAYGRKRLDQFTWPITVISDHVNATIETFKRVFCTYSNYGRLLQSIADTNICGSSKPEVVFPRCSPCVRHVLWVDSDSLRLTQSNTGSFQDGSSKPEVVTLCTIVSRRLDISIDSDCPRHVQYGSVKKPGWAIIAEVTKIAHISVVYWPISKRSTVPRRAGGPLASSKMADSNPSSLRVDFPIRVHEHLVARNELHRLILNWVIWH